MKTRVDERFIREIKEFHLLYTCSDCVHFETETQECSCGYPSEEHNLIQLDKGEILFCKLFEAS